MNFDKNFITTLEIDPSEVENEQEFLKLTRAEVDEYGYINLELEVKYSGFYQKAKLYGAWEESYPEEFELEINDIYYEGDSIIEFFSKDLIEKVEELAEINCNFN